jgi:hypothetical protein
LCFDPARFVGSRRGRQSACAVSLVKQLLTGVLSAPHPDNLAGGNPILASTLE